MKIIFFGSDDFAEAHVRSLIDSGHELLACVTQPDRPKGRGMKVVVSPIKECALERRIPVLQPASLKDASFIKDLKDLQSDLFVVIAYGKFLPPEVLDIPLHGALNVHASLLPKYRGAAPINWAIINGEKETGISVIKINEKMDAGDILAQVEIKIEEDETAPSLRAKMMNQGPPFLLRTINDLPSCALKIQDHDLATFAVKLTKELGHIEWGSDARGICNLVKGLLMWPGAYTFYNGKLLKILEAQVLDGDSSKNKPGTVSGVGKKGIVVSTGNGRLLIKEVHLQDAKPMDAHSFVVGHAIEVGYKFV
ncbi:MAG: methionyl-tRNA formyltransferase [Candidatus Omnitrophica bacterium]|nr:methionyl-tRNA formyltransferase [Candidatus Omnitrophota bacterium]